MIDIALRSRSPDPFVNLAIEEALLEHGPCGRDSGGALFLYANAPCVVVGRNQNPWAEVPEGPGLPVLRRVSGGGAVYHDEGNLNWALILPRRLHDRGAELGLVASSIRELGIGVEEGPRGGLFVASGLFAGAKVSGTARRIGAERVLHHGTILVSSDLSLMGRSLGGIELAASRGLPSVQSACANLASILPGLEMDEVAESLARTIAGGSSEGIDADGPLVDHEVVRAAEARLRSWDWTWGATPTFSVSVPGCGQEAWIEVQKGRVASMSGPGTEACSSLVGAAFDYGIPKACARAMKSG